MMIENDDLQEGDENEEMFSSSEDELEENVADEEEAQQEGEGLNDLTQIYLHEIGLNPLLEPSEEGRLSRLVKQGDFEARQKMIKHNLRLVVNIAKHYLHRGVPLLDLVEEGNLGLIHALEKFDPERGFRFSTYATWWIRQNIERAIMNQSRTIRLPVHVIKELNLVLRAVRYLEPYLDGDVTPEDVSHLLDKPAKEIRQILTFNESMTSLDAPLEVDSMLSVGESIPDEQTATPDAQLENNEIENLIHTWLEQLNEKQRQVIEHRFGLGGQEICTLEVLAENLGLTRERVRQIQIEALQHLRRILKRGGVSKEGVL